MGVSAAVLEYAQLDSSTGGNVDKATGSNYKRAKGKVLGSAKAPPLPPPPVFDEHQARIADENARERQRQRAVGAYGRSDTVLTGGLGLIGDRAPVGQRKTLLGL